MSQGAQLLVIGQYNTVFMASIGISQRIRAASSKRELQKTVNGTVVPSQTQMDLSTPLTTFADPEVP